MKIIVLVNDETFLQISTSNLQRILSSSLHGKNPLPLASRRCHYRLVRRGSEAVWERTWRTRVNAQPASASTTCREKYNQVYPATLNV